VDLERELLDVLDNPARVWHSIVNNFATEPRICLLAFATCETPLDIVEWQAVVARVDLAAAVRFEASLRVLDDAFVSMHKGKDGIHYAVFRNPSMDDFCAGHLDANAGFATTVATRNPSLQQVTRLIQLAGARDADDRSRPRYSNLHTALLADPEILIGRLLDLLPITPDPSPEFMLPARTLLQLLSLSDISKQSRLPEIRARLTPSLLRMSFPAYAPELYELLDNRQSAIIISALLGDRFEEFYLRLAGSASQLGHFDTLVNVDQALGRSPAHASWAERFEAVVWLSDDDDASLLRGDLELYTKIAEHLDLDVYDALQEWEAAVEEAEANELRAERDESWGDSPFDDDGAERIMYASAIEADHRERATLDALFASLAHER
jgi:hypothetical protein